MDTTKRLLIIDPDEGSCRNLSRSLEGRGYDVSFAVEKPQTSSYIENSTADLIVAHINGHGSHCLDFLTEAKKSLPEALFVIIADQVSSGEAIDTLREGAADLLIEPVSEHDITAAVETALLAKEAGLSTSRLFRYLDGEERTFTFPTSDAPLGAAVDLLTENLAATGLTNLINQRLVAMALTEALGNALYHGNLEIDPRLKIEHGDEAFKAEANKRLADPRYRDRKILVSYKITHEEARYVITDDGDGFDHTEASGATPDDLVAEKGRGLSLLRAIMDEVSYNEKGNQVTLVKKAII